MRVCILCACIARPLNRTHARPRATAAQCSNKHSREQPDPTDPTMRSHDASFYTKKHSSPMTHDMQTLDIVHLHIYTQTI